ncbi:hypothetical protein MTR67_035007, partial [Solanum verrucosum]
DMALGRDYVRRNAGNDTMEAKVDGDPQESIDKVYKIVGIMGLSLVKMEELAAYQLNDVSQVWFEQWKSGRAFDIGCLTHSLKEEMVVMELVPPLELGMGWDGRHVQPSDSGSVTPKKNRLYALSTCQYCKVSPDVVIGIVKVFHLVFYALLDPSATLSFVTPYMSMRFDVSPKILSSPFHGSTSMDDAIMANRVYRKCLISLSHRVSHVDLVKPVMVL